MAPRTAPTAIGFKVPYSTYLGVLDHTAFGLTPAELHGGISGALSVGGLPAALGWVRQCYADGEYEPASADEEHLRMLVQTTLEAFEAAELKFEPLLPEDEAELAQRVEALALWCHGFLAGLAVGGLHAEAQLSQELEEIVGDFAEISRAALVAEERTAARDSEFDFVQLAEYVRVGAQLAFEELASVRAAAVSHEEHH